MPRIQMVLVAPCHVLALQHVASDSLYVLRDEIRVQFRSVQGLPVCPCAVRFRDVVAVLRFASLERPQALRTTLAGRTKRVRDALICPTAHGMRPFGMWFPFWPPPDG